MKSDTENAKVDHLKSDLGRILILDDEKDFRELAGMHLTHEGFSCTLVSNAQEALFELKTRRFDLAIVDWKLPDGSGKEVLLECKRIHPETPVIVITGVVPTTENVQAGALEAGADRFLSKPWTGNVFINEIKKLMYQSELLLPRRPEDIVPLEQVKRRYIRRAIELLEGNQSLTAEKLEIHRNTVADALKLP